MIDLTYDPELPYVVYAPGSKEINSRFKYENEAFTHRGDARHLEVVDTTPKPKIPEDAEYLIWRGDRNSILEFAEKTQGYWSWSGLEISETGLIECIGHAEVTVLVRKEES